MNKVKKFGVAVLGTVSSLAVMAEETAGGGTSESVGESVISGAQETLEGILTSAGTAVTSILLAGLAIWAGIAIIGLIKRSFNAGKGR